MGRAGKLLRALLVLLVACQPERHAAAGSSRRDDGLELPSGASGATCDASLITWPSVQCTVPCPVSSECVSPSDVTSVCILSAAGCVLYDCCEAAHTFLLRLATASSEQNHVLLPMRAAEAHADKPLVSCKCSASSECSAWERLRNVARHFKERNSSLRGRAKRHSHRESKCKSAIDCVLGPR